MNDDWETYEVARLMRINPYFRRKIKTDRARRDHNNPSGGIKLLIACCVFRNMSERRVHPA